MRIRSVIEPQRRPAKTDSAPKRRVIADADEPERSDLTSDARIADNAVRRRGFRKKSRAVKPDRAAPTVSHAVEGI